MRSYGAMHPTDGNPMAADTVGVAAIGSTGAAVGFDLPAGANMLSFSANINYAVNFNSTAAAWPSTSSTGSSTNSVINPGVRQCPSSSTGFSIAGEAAGVVTWEAWKK